MHILTLFYSHLLVDFENGGVVETQSNVSEREDGLHSHKEGYSGFDRKRVWWQRVLQKELVELSNLFAAERQNMDQREEALDVEGVALAQPETGVDLFLLVLFDLNLSFLY